LAAPIRQGRGAPWRSPTAARDGTRDISPAFSPELRLAVACCRWPVTDASRQLVRELAAQVGDWERFDLVVQRNRIGPLAHRALVEAGVEVPAPVGQALSRRAHATARKSLAMARESILLQRALERLGIPVLILKGAPLAILAYGELGLKDACDVDVLTTEEFAPRVIAVLVELGYHNGLAHLEPTQLDAYLRLTKEAPFAHPVSGLTVDLHWRVIANRHLLKGVGAAGPAQDVPTPVGALRTIADAELFAYLCLHGAGHNWSRLKWIADLGAWLANRDEADLKRLLDTSRTYGADRAASVALLLCHGLLGRPLSEGFLTALRKDRMNLWLERNVLAGLGYRAGTAEHVEYTAPWLRAMIAQFVLSRGPIHAIEHARNLWTSPVDRLETPLPPRLEFLYPLARLPLWLVRKGRTMMRRLLR
jgi:hypothetical protein